MQHKLRVLVLLCLILPPAAAGEERDFRIQNVKDANEIVSLDSSAEHGWWISFRADLDPVATTRRLLADPGEADRPGPDFHPAPVPGQASEAAAYPQSGADEFWYLKRFRLPADFEGQLSLRLGEIDDRDRTYLNGRLIGATGDWASPRAEAYERQRIYNPPEALLRKGGVNVLLVHVREFSPGEGGIIKDTTAIGPTAALNRAHVIVNFVELVVQATYLTAGFYFLFLFVRRRRERENAYFALFTILFACYSFLRTQIKYELGVDFLTAKRVEYTLLFAQVPAFYYFVRHFLRLGSGRILFWWDRAVLAITLVLGGCIVYLYISDDAYAWWILQRDFVQYLWIVYVGGILTLLIVSMLRGQRDAFYMLGGFSPVVLGLALDILSARGSINLPATLSYMMVFFFLALALILANRFVRVNEEVEDLNENLERKVTERTEQLNDSLTEVSALKEQQDGDYFLTSLLITPLGGNFASQQPVQIDMLVRQKKKFRFRHWEAEIGGDLCAAYDIELYDRPCTVFLNGDAMGKSMQGAGGALVLGTVFKSVVTRTALSQAGRERDPERWLAECHAELQSVFLTFDGSMLVSAQIGLVDHQSGLMYFINAEHPFAVHFRDGRADFLETDVHLRKIGFSNSAYLRVSVFRLGPADVILLGSDGRDDLALGTDANGHRIINEDERAFLKLVERAGGSLAGIHREILAAGEITDDLALMRVSYREDQALAETGHATALLVEAEDLLARGDANGARELLREQAEGLTADDPARALLGRLLLRTKEYAGAADLLDAYCTAAPWDSDAIHLLAGACKGAGRRTEAIRHGERLLLRRPDQLANLVNLADSYRLTGRPARARALLDRARMQNPNDENVRRLDRLLE